MTNEEMKIQETITALKKMSDVLYKDGYLWYSDVCDDAVNIIEKLIATNNAPLTLESEEQEAENEQI